MNNRLWLVIPCYNEEEMLPITYPALKAKLASLIAAGKIAEDSKIAFVNDGSRDKTWEIISAYHAQDPAVVGVNLAHNRGHQNALLAGLMVAKDHADFTVSLDADLQDDIDAIDAMTDQYLAGDDIVFGVRSSRKKDSFFKRATAEGFYKVMNKMGVETVFNHADFRLMDRRALEALSEYREVNLFLRGIVTDLGFRTSVVTYERGVREKGESKYPLKKMLALAVNGITSFSTKPLSVAFKLAVLCGVLCVAGLACGFVDLFVWKFDPALFFLLAAVFCVGSMVLAVLDVIGLYVGKIYLESKARPRYVISDVLLKD